jgi:prolipoprotein diacylglyceryl transferase
MNILLAFIHWNPSPEIFSIPASWPLIGGYGLRWYGVLFSLGFVVGYYLMLGFFKREGKSQEDLDTLTLYMVAATVIGARLGHCLFYDPSYYLSHPLEILKVWEGGLASHGAVISILLGLWLYARNRKDQPFLWVVDRIVVVTALAGCFIRLGNLMNSEIIGAPTSVPWAFIFDRVDSQPRHPSQLYEATFYFLSFLVLFWLYRRMRQNTPHGFLLGLFLILVFGFRFLVEFMKEVQVPFEQGMSLNMGQWLSIPCVLLGIWLLWRVRSKVGPALKAA